MAGGDWGATFGPRSGLDTYAVNDHKRRGIEAGRLPSGKLQAGRDTRSARLKGVYWHVGRQGLGRGIKRRLAAPRLTQEGKPDCSSSGVQNR